MAETTQRRGASGTKAQAAAPAGSAPATTSAAPSGEAQAAAKAPAGKPTFSGILKGFKAPEAPKRAGNGMVSAFPFDDLGLGDAFLVAEKDVDRARASLSSWNRKNSKEHPTLTKNHKGKQVPVRVASKFVLLTKLTAEQAAELDPDQIATFGERPFAVFRVQPPAVEEPQA